MKRVIILLALFVLLLGVAAVGVIVWRDNRFDSGVMALKEDNGAMALQRLLPLAQLGDAEAQETVGWIYAIGAGGVRKDDNAAIYWFRKTGRFGRARMGNDAAARMSQVAAAYANGSDGAPLSKTESRKWLKLAASEDSAPQ